MAYGFMRQSNGWLAIASEESKGSTVTLSLPAKDKEAAPRCAPVPRGRDRASSGSKRVLMVEDQPDIGALVEAILSGAGYRVTVAVNADAALALLEGRAGFDLLFSDLIMPGAMNGVMLARAARQRFPDLRVLLTTGFAAEVVDSDAFVAGEFEILAKPYRRAELLARVRAVLDAPVSSRAR